MAANPPLLPQHEQLGRKLHSKLATISAAAHINEIVPLNAIK